MDVPVLSYDALKTHGITQPIGAKTPVAPIVGESPASGNLAMKYEKRGKQPQAEDWVDISDLARRLAKGRPAR